ncbi:MULTISPECIES: RNA-guided endonuclease TnpB family protein [unclassified Pseudofrankia]|uniref:RNA-guided endonuclease InsQ/TnpB family protein n=1 Tax=unclassified Pseudofrankia TaxID=2994372 RepID=UPI0008D96FB2|nr:MULTISPECIES: RNA-guided endonuclease TnpB family protein [unclassified Pseudofrankia]MDT3442518.1 transposase [Pseudofrankia sp. BMG5.37]OHV74696.1 transposase [Pseudofrankia sp. BMG5.36]
MSRFRLYPAPEQAAALDSHCGHARLVWNLAVEQQSWWTPRRGPAPGYAEQNRQLTEARHENPWLAEGSVIVQQQALRDYATALASFFRGPHRKPTFRKRGRSEGFRIVAVKPDDIRVLNRRWSEVRVPKVGWVRFRRSRSVPDARSYRVTKDRAGRWHVAFAAPPEPVGAPGTGEVVGVDRGVAVSAALSTGDLLRCPGLRPKEAERLARLQRHLAKTKRGSNRRGRIKVQIARLRARDADRRKDWAEKTSTDLARRFDLIRVEDLNVKNMTKSARGTVAEPGRNVRQKAGLNRSILANGWGLLVQRLEQKAPGRIEKVNPAYTSQRCSACGHVAAESRESQATFRCVACGHEDNGDVNAAKNIARGHRVAARGGVGLPEPVNREPQRTAPPLVAA